MLDAEIQMSVPVESFFSTIKSLTFENKIKLYELIEKQIEEELLTRNPKIQQEINEAREAYKVGDYISLDEYKARNKERLL